MPDEVVRVSEPEDGYLCPVCDETLDVSSVRFFAHLKECGKYIIMLQDW
jgi:hypothetical protein